VRTRVQAFFRVLGRVGIAFLVLLVVYLVAASSATRPIFTLLLLLALIVTGFWLAIRVLRIVGRQATWRLRNRLLVTYLFIAVVPVLLLVTLAGAGVYFLSDQLAVYLVTSELDRRIDGLRTAADSIVRTVAPARPALIERMTELFYKDTYPGLEIVLRDSGKLFRYPSNGTLPPPPAGWQPISGVLLRDGQFYSWCHARTDAGDVTVTAPLTREYLARLVPHLGLVDIDASRGGAGRRTRLRGTPKGAAIPPARGRFDQEVFWVATVPTSNWDQPGKLTSSYLLVRSRLSAVLDTVFNRPDEFQGIVQAVLIGGPILFLVVEFISMIIGISMTRTMTGAVHRLYEGTQKVIGGNFGHRIEVTGRDQLAELSHSFNRMTENLERLLVVAKEKERLQSEVEIAREVQNQLYPRKVPVTRTLRLTAVCKPARMVSGDYYDYEVIRETQIAMAIGDVAGKGISAALLMATLQSSLRTQLQSWLEVAAAAGTGTVMPAVATSVLMSRLNNQLHAYTSPEKFATFCLGIYDEASGDFNYTNAGHLPPVLVSEGVPQRLDVNGTVVGAFPFSKYDESRVHLNAGDLLVCFTDGVTEPENAYGEMFGEDRLVDLIARNAHRSDDQIVEIVMDSVNQWTATAELQDDMTILLARRV
jgi:sigma-B regulation protein RsbU (phosphoserine phosphatase)